RKRLTTPSSTSASNSESRTSRKADWMLASFSSVRPARRFWASRNPLLSASNTAGVLAQVHRGFAGGSRRRHQGSAPPLEAGSTAGLVPPALDQAVELAAGALGELAELGRKLLGAGAFGQPTVDPIVDLLVGEAFGFPRGSTPDHEHDLTAGARRRPAELGQRPPQHLLVQLGQLAAERRRSVGGERREIVERRLDPPRRFEQHHRLGA